MITTQTNTFTPALPLTTAGGQSDLTMSSYQIAKLVNKRHSDVKKICAELNRKELLTGTEISHPFISGGNNAKQQIEVYELNERDSYLLVARLSPEYTAHLVDEWRRLKDLTTPTLPQTKLAWMKLAVAQEEKLQSQQQLLEEALPKIEFAEQVSAAKGVMTFSEAAKKLKLGYGRNTLFQKLHDVGYLYTHGREKNMPKQHLTESGSGYFTVKESIYKNSKNEPCSTSTTLITPKGLLAISKKLAALDIALAL